jgi:predicted nucleic acid-binding protein
MYLLDTDILIDIQRGHKPVIATFVVGAVEMEIVSCEMFRAIAHPMQSVTRR